MRKRICRSLEGNGEETKEANLPFLSISNTHFINSHSACPSRALPGHGNKFGLKSDQT